jgi:lipopolysaccharide biosynthesis protein
MREAPPATPLARAISNLRKTRNAIRGCLRFSPPAIWVRRIRDRSRGDPADVPFKWLNEPGDLTGRNVCLFVTYDRTGRITPHVYLHAKAWAERGYDVVLLVALDDLITFDSTQDTKLFSGVMLRQNAGYDFGAWAAGIRALPSLSNAQSLVTLNDSIYGPMRGFDELVHRLCEAPADVVGLTESFDICRHFQSFLLVFNSGALQSEVFWEFWKSVRLGDRAHVIDSYELTLAKRMESGGLTTMALFPGDPHRLGNPTIDHWRRLIRGGFPYIKVQLIRENPRRKDISDWPDIVAAHGYDTSVIFDHLA